MRVRNVAIGAGQLAIAGVCVVALAPLAALRIQASLIVAGTTYAGDAIITGGTKANLFLQSLKSAEEEVVVEEAAAAAV